MRKYIYSLITALVLPLTLTSCHDDEDTTTSLTNKGYISSFSLGTLKRTIYSHTTAGMDSIYTTSFSSIFFPMIIDHRALIIENHDSLPQHTVLNAVLTSAGFDGTLTWRKAKPQTEGESEWKAYSASDSLDLRDSLHLRIVPTTGNGERIYTLKVNVHQQEADSTSWNYIGETSALGGIGERRALIWNNKLTVLYRVLGGKLVCVQHDRSTSGEWTKTETTGTDLAMPSTIQQMGDKLYLSTTDGNVLESTNATEWTATAYPTLSGLQLVAASNEYLYALANGKLYSSNGGEWTEEKLDSDAGNLPTENLNHVFYTLKDGTPRLILVGSRNNTDETATIWAKSWNTDNKDKGTWIYYSPNDADKYRCPMLENLCVVRYDGGLQALGGKSGDGKHTALDFILHSSDHGISWKTYEDNDMEVDTELREAAQRANDIKATVDEDNFLWIVVDSKVWRGRINRLGWKN